MMKKLTYLFFVLSLSVTVVSAQKESNLSSLFPEMDATVAYQAIFNPGLDPNNEFGSAISLRFRSTW